MLKMLKRAIDLIHTLDFEKDIIKDALPLFQEIQVIKTDPSIETYSKGIFKEGNAQSCSLLLLKAQKALMIK